jgi:hypothetical protein
MFSLFSITSIVTDSVNGMKGGRLERDEGTATERYIYENYAAKADPLLIVNTPQVRWSAAISAFLWLPLYIFFVIGFIKGWNHIRVPGLIYGGALTHGMITYMAEGTTGYWATEGWRLLDGCVEPNTTYYLACNIPYLLIPFLMIIRMWKANPFGQEV